VPSTTESAKQLCGSLSDIVELRLALRQGVTLVRPDGYIAYSAHNHDDLAALRSARLVLERQTDRSPAPHDPVGSAIRKRMKH